MTSDPQTVRQEIQEALNAEQHPYEFDSTVAIARLEALIQRERRAAVEEFIEKYNKVPDLEWGGEIGFFAEGILSDLFPEAL